MESSEQEWAKNLAGKRLHMILGDERHSDEEVGRAAREALEAGFVIGVDQFGAARTAISLVQGLHALVFGVHSLQDPEHSHAALSDDGEIHEYVHTMIRALPAEKENEI